MGLMRPQLPRLGCLATVRSVLLWACHLPWLWRWAELNPHAAHLVSKPGARKVPATSSAAWRLARLQARLAQEREHGRDTPVHLLLAGQVQLGEDRVDVLLD
jgi:hypothetical protein